MKIALVYDLLYPYSIGGAEARYFFLGKELVLRGHEVHLIGVKIWKGQNKLRITKNFYMHGLSRYHGDYHFFGKRKTLEPLRYSLSLFFWLMKHDFDILDVSAFPYFPPFSVKMYSALKKKPIVITWHEVWDDYWKGFGVRGIFGRMIERRVAKLSKNNICVSELTGKRLSRIGAKKKDIQIIPNWVELDEIKKAKPFKRRYDIISIGRHLKHKNFDLLLKVCGILIKKFPSLLVMIIGYGPETTRILKMRKALDLERNVQILNFAQQKETMYRYLKSSKIFVLLSELEGFSITAFEAMACGLPIITLKSEHNALSEIISQKNLGFLCNKEPFGIALNIERLLKDKSLRKKISIRNRNFASNYNVSEQINKIEMHYKLVCLKRALR